MRPNTTVNVMNRLGTFAGQQHQDLNTHLTVIIKYRITWPTGSIANLGGPGNKERCKTARKKMLKKKEREREG